MVETVLLRCSLVLGEVSSCVVSKIITGPQSTKNLMLGEKPVLPFKMEQNPSCKPGLHCEKLSTAQSCVFCFSSWRFFCTSGSATEGKGFSFALEALETPPHLPCKCPTTGIVTQWWGKQVCSRIPGTATDPCCALQVAVCWSCAVSRLLFKPRWSISGGVHHHQWGIMVIAQEQNPCADTIVSTHCPWRVYNLQLNFTSADQKGSTLR